MARKKKPEEPEGHVNHERWMVAYADILTLLLALFIVMFAMAALDRQKVELFAQGAGRAYGMVMVAGREGMLSGGDGVLTNQAPGTPDTRPAETTEIPENDAAQEQSLPMQTALQRQQAAEQAAANERANLEKVRQQIQTQLKAVGLADAAQFELNERGLVVNIVTDKVLFDTGQHTLRPEGRKVIDAVAPILKGIPNYMSIEGHTDDVPLNGVRSNWELSTDRASAVLRTLVTEGIPMSKVSASGYADQRPIASNKNDAGRSKNRRVAVVVLPTVPLSNSAAAANAVQQPVPGPAAASAGTPSNKAG